ncbi:MAG: hypothetical protein FJ011_17270 [Chloroflexi bacterium]|nr:hypothetical protein [Chloroflexota bacterium]
MRRHVHLAPMVLMLCLLLLGPHAQAGPQGLPNLPACKDLAFSTEEDFLSQGPTPPDGNPIISDGDLLGLNHAVCARNRELLASWQVQPDLGLDAVDVVIADAQRGLVAFSTELDDPAGRFKAGDLLTTNGAIIPNVTLLSRFQVGRDLGLDGLHFTGAPQQIVAFLDAAAKIRRDEWLANPGQLVTLLNRYEVDIWFSTEGTELQAAVTPILDGHVLSARLGAVVVNQADLLPVTAPAGIPNRGVDFGLDALAASRRGTLETIRFSTEILFRGTPGFTDGDVLKKGDGIETTNSALVAPFEPKARFLGLDALYINLDPAVNWDRYLPYILKHALRLAE